MKDIFFFLKKFGFINFLIVGLTFTNILELGFLFGYAAIGLILLKKNVFKSELDLTFFLLFTFSISYSLFYFTNPWKGLQYFLIYMLSPAAFYLWGKQIPKSLYHDRQIITIVMFIGVIYSLPALISVMLNILEGGFAQHERSIAMFWGGPRISATGMAQFFMFNICIPGIFFSLTKRMNKILILFFAIIFVLSLACVLRVGSRTLLGIMMFSLVFSIIFVSPKLSFKQLVVRFGFLLVLVFFIIQNVSFDFDSEIFTTFASRMEEGGTEELAGGGGRVDKWEKSFHHMKIYPNGWSLDRFGYSHNLWLDTFRVGGFVSFFLLIVFTLRFLATLFSFFRSSQIIKSVRLIFTLYCISFLLIFMVEPGIDGNYSLFILFCLFSGILQSCYTAQENAVHR